MIRRTQIARLVVVFSLGSLTFPTNLAAAGAPITPPYEITAVKAMLFYDGSATFSPDVLAKPDFRFWNTIIGEGDAKAPSNSTLVLVEVTGHPSPNEAPHSRKVELTATTSRKILLKRTIDIGLFGNDGKFYAAFWLYDTGCTPVALKARIVGQAEDSAIQKTLNFRCGD